METPYVDKSFVLDGTSQQVFAAEKQDDGSDRFIHNQPGNNTLWVNIFGNPAVANGVGCIGLIAGAMLNIDSNLSVFVLGAAGQKISAGER